MSSQADIIRELGVAVEFTAAIEARRRVDFLKNYLSGAGLTSYVLGISGGVDSLTAGLLAMQAVRELRNDGYSARFVAVRLPYGVQTDEKEAQAALCSLDPDETYTVNIKAASDAALSAVKLGGVVFKDAAQEDFLLGNIKARQRMLAQFAIAGALPGLVIGTDHAAEAVMGFFTKFGDGAADIMPLAGLTKRRVRALARSLGAPESLVMKVPTADLENNAPQRPDEDVFGVTYEQIDDFLEGRAIEESARARIMNLYAASAHKRSLPVVPDL